MKLEKHNEMTSRIISLLNSEEYNEQQKKKYKERRKYLDDNDLESYDEYGDYPKRKENESINDWNNRLVKYIKENDLHPFIRDQIPRETIYTTRKGRYEGLDELQLELDTILNAYSENGYPIGIYNYDNFCGPLTPIPQRFQGESIEDWSKRIDIYCRDLIDREIHKKEE